LKSASFLGPFSMNTDWIVDSSMDFPNLRGRERKYCLPDNKAGSRGVLST